jgi:hypothetical protein
VQRSVVEAHRHGRSGLASLEAVAAAIGVDQDKPADLDNTGKQAREQHRR